MSAHSQLEELQLKSRNFRDSAFSHSSFSFWMRGRRLLLFQQHGLNQREPLCVRDDFWRAAVRYQHSTLSLLKLCTTCLQIVTWPKCAQRVRWRCRRCGVCGAAPLFIFFPCPAHANVQKAPRKRFFMRVCCVWSSALTNKKVSSPAQMANLRSEISNCGWRRRPIYRKIVRRRQKYQQLSNGIYYANCAAMTGIKNTNNQSAWVLVLALERYRRAWYKTLLHFMTLNSS